MKIEQNPQILALLERCRTNLSHDELNSFLDRRVLPSNEGYIQRQLKKAGSPEFSGEESAWPSLFLSVSDWEKSPYHSAVTMRLSAQGGLYEEETFAGNRLFNADSVQPDPDRELKDWMKLRALDRDATTLVLADGDTEWMLDAPGEASTNDPCAEKAHGNVITFGLGIGYFLFMALRNSKVSHVTVIEREPAVIDSFQRLLMPLFPDQERFTIVSGDALDFWNREILSAYDYIYADIWQSSEDGLFLMKELLCRYVPETERADFWIEDSCVVPLRTLIFLHFEELVYRKRRAVSPDYEALMDLVRRYFETVNENVTEPERLKFLMYDRTVLRSILGGNS